MFPENISKNFDRVREIAFSNLPIEEKMKLFESFGEIEVFYKNNVKSVKNCFLPVDGFEDYAVNPYGDVISSKHAFVKLLSKACSATGYYTISLCNGKTNTKNVHILVTDAFLQKVENKQQVNHIDGNRENNRLDNLEYCTAKENIQHEFRTGLCSKRGLLTEDELNKIVEMLNAGSTYCDIAYKFNISPELVRKIAKGKRHREIFARIDVKKKVNSPRRVKCLESGKIYNSYGEASKDLKLCRQSFTKYFNRKISHVGGYHFERV